MEELAEYLRKNYGRGNARQDVVNEAIDVLEEQREVIGGIAMILDVHHFEGTWTDEEVIKEISGTIIKHLFKEESE